MNSNTITILVFIASLLLTFGAVLLARLRNNVDHSEDDLAGRKLNRWMIGLSAATTGNSGFIVTGAVGLGYAYGAHWLLLPLSWLLGDLLFWRIFPERLNALARKAKATTLSEALTYDLQGNAAKWISVVVAILLVTFLATYTSSQWLAGKKFLSGVFALDDFTALLLFSATIVAYSSLGGFRGSVYADVLQAFIRILGTTVALVAVTWFAITNSAAFQVNIQAAGPDFLSLFGSGSIFSIVGFVGGFALAAVGFGLGQPQIVTRYMAGSSPAETKAAWWIYIGFLQFTWISMTVFGMVLRGVMPGLADPETGLSLFFQQNIGAVATGIIFADIYATIASTSNGIIVAIAQTLQRDILVKVFHMRKGDSSHKGSVTFVLGVITILLSFVLPGNVFSIAVDSISKIGAGIAGPMIIKTLGWRHTANSLLLSILSGIGSAYLWSSAGFGSTFNEAGIGIACSLLVNWIATRVSHEPIHSAIDPVLNNSGVPDQAK